MAWDDKPTDRQISLLYHWFDWKMSLPKAHHCLSWLEKNATRKQVSKEIERVGELYRAHKLDRENCFDSEIWNGYEYDENYEKTFKWKEPKCQVIDDHLKLWQDK